VSDESRPDATDGTPKRKGRAKKKHTIGRVILASVVVLALVTGLGVIYLYRHLNGNLDVNDITAELGDDRPEEIYKGNGEPLDILVLGDDTRSGDNRIDNESGGGSDTNILVHLSADRTRAYAVSIPRDSIVDRPDCGEDDEIPGGTDVMWNAAYSVGGAACTIRQLEAMTDVRVENYVVVDFNGFKDMVDAVGGVPVCVPQEINDPSKGIFVPAGKPALLKGDQALDYVRVRSNIGDESDLGRIKRQQNFIAALVNKVKSRGTLTRFDRVVRFLDAATDSLEVDEGLGSVTRIGKIAMQLSSIGLDKVQFVTVPNAYYTRDSGFFGRVYWTDEAKQLWRRIRLDKPLPANLADGTITAARPPGASETPDPTANPPESESPGSTPPESEEPLPETPSGSEEPTSTDTADPSPTEGPSLSAEEAEKAGLCA